MRPNRSHLPSFSMTEIQKKHEPAGGDEGTLASKSKEPAMRWLDSDLVGIPATLPSTNVAWGVFTRAAASISRSASRPVTAAPHSASRRV
jgi:hypothetical protein